MSTDKPVSPAASDPPTASVLAFDADKYMSHLNESDLTEPQKAEFLHALWDIMSTFVRLGFDVDSVLPRFKEASESASDALEQIIPTHEFNVAGTYSTDKEE